MSVLMLNKNIRHTFSLFILLIIEIALTQAGQVAAQISALPEWVTPVLRGLGNLLGAMMLIALLFWLFNRAKAFLPEWLNAMDDAPAEADNDAQILTRDLAMTVSKMQRKGDKSGTLIQDTQRQTAALVDLIKSLSRKSRAMAEQAQTLDEALSAIASHDAIQIAKAAGAVKDEHIRTLMLEPYENTPAGYWETVSRLVATQFGTAQRWQREYAQLSANLIAEVSTIKARLTAVIAQLDAAEVARPLLQARVNLDTSAQFLRIASDESVTADRLLAPRHEYAIGNR